MFGMAVNIRCDDIRLYEIAGYLLGVVRLINGVDLAEKLMDAFCLS
jgi:hypothetical protein